MNKIKLRPIKIILLVPTMTENSFWLIHIQYNNVTNYATESSFYLVHIHYNSGTNYESESSFERVHTFKYETWEVLRP